MNRTSLLVAVALASSLAACSGPAQQKGTIPPGTPPPEYEMPRGYDPSATPPATATPAPAVATPAPATATPAPAVTAVPTTP